MDKRALAMILLNIKSCELIHVKNCKTAKSAWNVLNLMYKNNTPARKISLFKNLFKFKIDATEKLAKQLNKFCSIIEELKEIDIQLDDEILSILLLCTLPSEMENFVVAFETHNDLPCVKDLISKILLEEKRQTEKQIQHTEGETVLYASKNYKNVKKHVTKYNNLKCYNCGKQGHSKSECRFNNKYKHNSNKNSKQVAFHLAVEEIKTTKSSWILDSGASSHMCNNKSYFNTLNNYDDNVSLASGDNVKCKGMGNIEIRVNEQNILLKNVLYVPMLHANFISVSKIISNGLTAVFYENKAIVKHNEETLFEAKSIDNIFYVQVNVITNEEKVNLVKNNNFEIWHKRFGHLNCKDLENLLNNEMVYGLNSKIKIPKNFQCSVCAMCKITSKPFPKKSISSSNDILELIHTDICGPMQTTSQGGSKYFMTLIDDYSRYVEVKFLNNKSDAFEIFEEFVKRVEKQTGKLVKVLRSDNGREFINSKFKNFLKEKGIIHQTTVTYSPQQNGIAERANRTIVEMARCMLVESNVPQNLWAEAVNTATYIRNRSPTKILGNITPYEKWTGKKPCVTHFKKFGSEAIVLQKGGKRSKFVPKGNKFIFVGYACNTKGYRLFNKFKNQLILARDVIFFEENADFKNEEIKSSAEELKVNVFTNIKYGDSYETSNHEVDNVHDESNKEATGVISRSSSSENTNQQVEETEDIQNEDDSEEFTKTLRGRTIRFKPSEVVNNKHDKKEMVNAVTKNPNSIKEALTSENAGQWLEAMKKEYNSLMKNETWELVDKPDNKNIIGCKWVYTVKKDTSGNVNTYKARLVANGCAQKYKIDYSETFSPVIRHSTIRLILALAVQYKLLVHHIDITAAYLNGEIEEEVYMKQPPMFEDDLNSRKVCRLKKSLYGLKQSGREWNKKITDVLEKMNFTRCTSENCVYMKRENDGVTLLGLYVDDIIVACSSENDIQMVLKGLNDYVIAVDKGYISLYLGMQIERADLRGPIFIHQSKYIDEILEKWKMSESKNANTPMASGVVLEKCNGNCQNETFEKTYQSLLGELMYLSVISRPDIAHVVAKLSQFNKHPHKEHLVAAKHILRYLNGTKTKDADWGSDPIDRKSYSGYAVFLAGGLIAWESKKQPIVSLSSMEAEYISMCQGTKEVVFLRTLLIEMGFKEYSAQPTVVLGDNQGAQFLVQNPSVQKRSKHIDIKYHYIREKFNSKEVMVKYVESSENAADILTKCLNKEKHERCCELLKLKNF